MAHDTSLHREDWCLELTTRSVDPHVRGRRACATDGCMDGSMDGWMEEWMDEMLRGVAVLTGYLAALCFSSGCEHANSCCGLVLSTMVTSAVLLYDSTVSLSCCQCDVALLLCWH